jgi:alpha-glucosidase
MEIKWGTGRARLAALQEDVFRLRICRKNFAPDHSWAVVGKHSLKPSLPLSGADFYARTEAGSIVIDPATAEWTLRDARNRDFLGGKGMGFRDGRAFLQIDLAERDQIFGLGETTGPMNKRGLRRELWNIDVLGHAPAVFPELRSLYVSIPFRSRS